MRRISKPKLSLIVPLASLVAAWAFMAGGMYLSLLERDYVEYQPDGSLKNPDYINTTIHWSAYLFLLAVACIALGALWGQRTALRLRRELGEDHALARASHRFNNLLLWIGIGLGVIFVFGNFLSAFNDFSGRNASLLARILGVYVPIVLATALVILVILRAFVFRADALPQDHEDEALKAAERARRKNLGFGYAVPILTTAFAIVLGLLIYDATKTPLQTWVWVLIQAIVILGIIAGTRFANRAKVGEQPVPRPKAVFTSLAAGAANLNLVLSIAFAGVVSIIALASTGGAIDKLWDYGNGMSPGSLKAPTWQWYLEDLAPAKVLVLLVVIGTYLTITLRNRETDKPGTIAA